MESTSMDKNVVRKRPCSPITISLSRNKESNCWVLSKPNNNVKKFCAQNTSVNNKMNVKKGSHNRTQGTMNFLLKYFSLFLISISFLERIINEYWNDVSKQVVKEQFERNERIKLQQDREERSRIERARKQRLYNGDLIDNYDQQQAIEFELVLETNLQTNDIVIEVPSLLVINMKPHQSKKLLYYLKLSFDN